MIFIQTVSVQTNGFCDILDLTSQVLASVQSSGITDGLITLFCPGSTGAFTTIEFESGALQDLKEALENIAPSDASYHHDKRWGDGNGFSHVRAALMKPSLSIPLAAGKPTLGTWQQIVFIDFDNRPRRRELVVQILGG